MAKPHDALLKQLIDTWSPHWTPTLCQQVGLSANLRADPLDADLSVASHAADKLFRLDGGTAGLLHLELESSWAGGQALNDLLLYNVLADYRYGGPVYSILMLLRREAWSPQITGVLNRTGHDGRVIHQFHYTPVRVWELACEPLLQGPIGILPLAMLTDEAQRDLPGLVSRIDQRLRRDAPTPVAADSLWTSCSLMLGMRMDRSQAIQLFQGARTMRDSSVYQAILAEGRGEGRVEGALDALRGILRRQGEHRFGAPSPEAVRRLNEIGDRQRLERMTDRVFTAADWTDLLNTP